MPSVKEIKETIKTIENIISEKLQSKKVKEKEDYFWENHYDLMEKHPFLVTQLCSGEDKTMLNFMLQKLEQMEKGNVEKNTADEQVGQKIVDTFVKPNLK